MKSLHNYDLVVISSSGGKDSQTALDVTVKLAIDEGYCLDNMYVVHADLGRAEWQGTKELAKAQADYYGLKFIAISRPQGDLLDHIEKKGMFPDSARRWCTSDHKRGQISKVYTQLTDEFRSAPGKESHQVQILEVLGFRGEESPARAKRVPFITNTRLSNTKRTVHTWVPIHTMLEDEVWATIKSSGAPYHEAYDLGMKRLSCVFCVFATRDQLILAGKHNPELLNEYVRVENKIGHKFQQNKPIADIKAHLLSEGVA